MVSAAAIEYGPADLVPRPWTREDGNVAHAVPAFLARAAAGRARARAAAAARAGAERRRTARRSPCSWRRPATARRRCCASGASATGARSPGSRSTSATTTPRRLLASVAPRDRRRVGPRRRGRAVRARPRRRPRAARRAARSPRSRAIANDLPPHATLALASRTQPPLPIARMRAQRCVTELGPRELAMTSAETAALLQGRAARGRARGRRAPAGSGRRDGRRPLSLASLFLAERGAAGARGGSAAPTASWRSTCATRCSPGSRRSSWTFMLRTSVADTLTAPLCDALAGRAGSAAMLAALARARAAGPARPLRRALPPPPPARRSPCARSCHATGARARGGAAPARERVAPRVPGTSTGRSSTRSAPATIAAAGDLVWENVAPLVAAGRTSTAERWLGRFTPGEIAEHATLALTAAGCALLRGQGQMAAHWTAAAAARATRHDAGAADRRRGPARARSPARPRPGCSTTAARAAVRAPAGRALAAPLIDGMARQLEGDRDGGGGGARGGRARRRGVRAARSTRSASRSSPCSRSTRTTGSAPRRS